MRGMKRIRLLLLTALVFTCLTACGRKESDGENLYQIYYLNNGESKVEIHPHEMQAEDADGQLEELLDCLSTNPEKLEYQAPLAKGFQVLRISKEGERLTIDVDEAYMQLPVTTEVLVRAAIVRTLTQLDGVDYVTITVQENQLYDSTGSPVGWMNAEQFIFNDGNEINTYELTKVKLYFALEDGTKLVETYREKHYSTNTPLERFVVEELIAGPSGQMEGVFPSVNPETRVVNVTTKDGICYVNLNESFLTVVNNVPTEVSVYAIVNSLMELNNVSKVQILINGEVPASFTSQTFTRNLDIVTTLEK